MALSIPSITELSTPPSKTDPTNFAQRADTFLGELPTLATETNAAIVELNKITSGLDQTEPIAAWSSGTTYNFPDVVAGSDGQTYRCIDTEVLNFNPTTDDGTKWLRLTNKFASTLQATTGTATDVVMSPATTKDAIEEFTPGIITSEVFQPATMLYVSPSGSNSNNGTAWATPFATIQYAIDSLRKHLTGDVHIRVGAGMYSEDLSISGFHGAGRLFFRGYTGSTQDSGTENAVNYKISSAVVTYVSTQVLFRALEFTKTGETNENVFFATAANRVFLDEIVMTSAIGYGVFITFGNLHIRDSIISNKTTCALQADVCGLLSSRINTGTNNVNALRAFSGILFKHNATQPSGTTAEATGNGGQIW